MISQNVYDTVTGRYLLLPRGRRSIGTYDSRIAYGQERVLVCGPGCCVRMEHALA